MMLEHFIAFVHTPAGAIMCVAFAIIVVAAVYDIVLRSHLDRLDGDK